MHMRQKKIRLGLMALLAITTVFTACGSKATVNEITEETSDNTTVEEAAVEEAAGEDTSKDTASEEAAVTYPVTITHAFGETVIESQPERIATISWGNQDVPLALGVVPVGVSKANFGAVDENGLLFWTADKYKELGAEEPVVFDDTDGLDYEAISDTAPDVILAAYSGITQEEYDLLSQIAPVIAYPEYPWQTYWREQTLLDARGMGKETEAEVLIAETEELIDTKVAEYESLQGKTAAFFYFNASDLGTFYIYLPTDPRASYLMDLGFEFPESVLQLADDPSAFTVTISAENIDSLKDIDMIVTYGDDSVLEALQADSLVGQIPAVADGALVMLDSTTALTASTTPSVLSIPATIDEYLALLNEAAEKVNENIQE